MDVVTGPIGNGVQQIVDMNPFAGVLIGALIAAVIYFVAESRSLKKDLNAERAARLEDKEKQLAEEKRSREIYERLADEQSKRRRT